MYKLGTSEDIWYCREKYPEVFQEPFQANALKPLGHATVCRHIESCLVGRVSPLNVLEIGHGGLSLTFEVFKDHEMVNLFGIDEYNQEAAVSRASLAALRERYENATFYSGHIGADTPSELREDFDLVYSVSVIEHIPAEDLNVFHAELKRLLKPGGMQVHSYDRPWGGEVLKMKDAIEAAGFRWLETPVIDGFWELDASRIARVVFEHPYTVMERFMYKMPREGRELYNWVTVVTKAVNAC
jgi:SAM-dependent methyltransferase